MLENRERSDALYDRIIRQHSKGYDRIIASTFERQTEMLKDSRRTAVDHYFGVIERSSTSCNFSVGILELSKGVPAISFISSTEIA